MAELERLRPHATDEEAAEIESALHGHIDALCAEPVVASDQGPMWWLRKWTATENEQWLAHNLPPIAPFPYWPHGKGEWDYLDHIMNALLTSEELYIPKSREMLTSWIVVGYITWFCQFWPGVGWLAQSEKDDKAMGLIRYANSLYRHQPDWMKALHPLKRGEEGTAHEIEWATGSRLVALAQGVRQAASYHPFGYFSDESAHQPAWKESLGVAKQGCKQTISVSSAAPSEFGYVCDESLAV